MDVNVSQYRTYYKWLAVKIACAIVIVAIVPLFTMAAFSRHFFVGSYKQKVLEHLTALVRIQQQKIDEFVTERLDALRLIGLTTTFQQLGDEAVLQDRLTTLQKIYGTSLLGLEFLDGQGVQISGTGSLVLRPGDQSAPVTPDKVLELGSYVREVHDGSSGLQYFILVVSVEQSLGKRMLVLTVTPDALNPILEDRQSAPAGRAAILNGEGTVVAPRHSSEVRHKVDCVEMQKVDALRHLNMSIGERDDGSALCIRAGLKNTDWVVEFAANTEEAYGAFSQPRLFALSTLLLGLAGIVVVAIFVSFRFSKYVARVDQEKQLINEQLVQAGKLASLGEMASGMAHEINNPVGIMVQEAQWIRTLLRGEEGNLAGNLDEIEASLSEIQTQGSRCREIIVKLVNFAQTDAPIVLPQQLNELVREIVGLCQQRAQRMKIELRLDLEPELLLVNGAQSDVQQVLMNVVNNALDAMEQDGGTLEVRTSTKARYAVVDVTDTGSGIPREHIGRVFEPFFSTKPVGRGTGLGLSICYAVMKKMKGDITIASEEGKGTTVHLFFPRQEQEDLKPVDGTNRPSASIEHVPF